MNNNNKSVKTPLLRRKGGESMAEKQMAENVVSASQEHEQRERFGTRQPPLEAPQITPTEVVMPGGMPKTPQTEG